MSAKIFISYSHKDEEFKNELIEHMAGLRRQNLVKIWHDRDINAGDEWKNKISEELESSEVILFLISPSFLNSDYCFEIEAKKAFEMHENRDATLIPVIIRHSDWKDTELANLNALPKDAYPVSSWSDKDEAWLNVIEGIKKTLKNTKTKVLKFKGAVEPKQKTLDWLNDTIISLNHRNVDNINLEEIFVVPELREIADKNEYVNYIDSTKVLTKHDFILLSGDEQDGKTSILKNYYYNFLKSSNIPLFINGNEINNISIQKILNKTISKQYENLSATDFEQQAKKIILIDDFEAIKLNEQHRELFLAQLIDYFDICILTIDSNHALFSENEQGLNEFNHFEISNLGHKQREVLYRKWFSLGVEQTINESNLIAQCETAKNIINSILQQNIVPAKPVYILSLLQLIEVNTELNLTLSSYGHCYQKLIYSSFEKANINSQISIETYLSILTQLAWWIFNNKKNPTQPQLRLFFQEYEKKYSPIKDYRSIVEKLFSISILIENENSEISFKYPYIYYFFVGKKISESYFSSDEAQRAAEYLIENLHREDNANILIFVTHHTREPWIIEKLNIVLQETFKEQSPSTLDKEQLKFMKDFVDSIPKLVYQERQTLKARDELNERKDLNERINPIKIQEDEFVDSEMFININRSFKSMEIAGQIIRNRHSSLERALVKQLTNNGIKNGLRFLDYFINISDMAKSEIKKFIGDNLEHDPTISDHEIQQNAQDIFYKITYGVIRGMIRKISSSLGTKEVIYLYEELVNEEDTDAVTLLKIAVELQFEPEIKFDNINNALQKLEKNSVCSRLLTEMVFDHLHMFKTDFKTKQKIQGIFKISTQSQMRIEQKTKNLRND